MRGQSTPSVVMIAMCLCAGTEYAVSRTATQAEGTGRLEVTHYGVTGRICDVGWSDQDAAVFCKAEGYPSGFAYVHSHANDYASESEVSGPPPTD